MSSSNMTTFILNNSTTLVKDNCFTMEGKLFERVELEESGAYTYRVYFGVDDYLQLDGLMIKLYDFFELRGNRLSTAEINEIPWNDLSVDSIEELIARKYITEEELGWYHG